MSASAITLDSRRSARWAAALVLALLVGMFVGTEPARAAGEGDIVVELDVVTQNDTTVCVLIVDPATMGDQMFGGCDPYSPGEEFRETVPAGTYLVQYYVEGHGSAYYPGAATSWDADLVTVTDNAETVLVLDANAFEDAVPEPDPTLVRINYTTPNVTMYSWEIHFHDVVTGQLKVVHTGNGNGSGTVVSSISAGEYLVAMFGFGPLGQYWTLLGNTGDSAQSPVFTAEANEVNALTFDASSYVFGELAVDFSGAIPSVGDSCAVAISADLPTPVTWWHNKAASACTSTHESVYVAPGNYALQFEVYDPASELAGPIYSGGVASLKDASTFTVAANATTIGHFTAAQTGSVTFSGGEGVVVQEPRLIAVGDYKARYLDETHRRVPYGDYLLEFWTQDGSRSYDAPFTWDSTPVTVNSASKTVSLAGLPVATLAGTVTREGNATAEASTLPREVTVYAHSQADDAYYAVAWGNTDSDGDYSFSKLAPGTYKVGFREYSSVYAPQLLQWYGLTNYSDPVPTVFYGGDDLASAEAIVLGNGGSRTDVDGVIDYTIDGDNPGTGGEEIEFSDIEGNQFADDILWMAETGISTGYDDGTFRPQASVSRQAMAAFMYRLAGEPVFTPPAVSPFTDVPTSHPFYKEITWMAEADISTGYDEGGGKFTYRPNDSVSRQAMSAFMYRLAGEPPFTAPGSSPFIDVASTSPFYAEIAWMADAEISTGYDEAGGKKSYRPGAAVSRQAMAAFMHRLDPLLAD